MSSNSQEVPMDASSVQLVEVHGVKIESEVVSSTNAQKAICELTFDWETTLQLQMGKKYITSGDYALTFGTEDKSYWRIELDPNFIDQNVRYLSAYLVLVKATEREKVINLRFEIAISPAEFPFDDGNCDSTRTGYTMFSKEKPAQGFDKFVPFIRLGRLADPNNTDKLRITVKLEVMKNAGIIVHEEEKVKVKPPFHKSKINYDAYVLYDGDSIRVDSQRLTHYTTYFDKYLIKDLKKVKRNKHPDLANEFESKPLLSKMIEYCHHGDTTVPKRLMGMVNVYKCAAKLKIIPLTDTFQSVILESITIDNFTEMVDLAKNGVLDREKAYPVLYEYMIANINFLEQNKNYERKYEDNENFYNELMVNCNG